MVTKDWIRMGIYQDHLERAILHVNDDDCQWQLDGARYIDQISFSTYLKAKMVLFQYRWNLRFGKKIPVKPETLAALKNDDSLDDYKRAEAQTMRLGQAPEGAELLPQSDINRANTGTLRAQEV